MTVRGEYPGAPYMAAVSELITCLWFAPRPRPPVTSLGKQTLSFIKTDHRIACRHVINTTTPSTDPAGDAGIPTEQQPVEP